VADRLVGSGQWESSYFQCELAVIAGPLAYGLKNVRVMSKLSDFVAFMRFFRKSICIRELSKQV